MKLKRIISGIFVCNFLLLSLIAQQRIVNLANFGISNSKDATPCVYEAIKSVEGKNAKFVFPKGIYHFYPDKALGKYHPVSNHDNTYRYFGFPLINCENIEIDGQGSDFIFHGVITPILVENSHDVTLRNFSIDWEEPFFLQAEVVANDSVNKTFDLLVSDMNPPHKLEGTRLWFTSNGLDLPFLGKHVLFDPKTKAVAYNSERCMMDGKNLTRLIEARKVSENRYTISKSGVKQLPKVGMIYVFKGPNGINRISPAIHFTESTKIDVENVNVYTAAGMGLIGENSEDIHLNGFNVKLREGTKRILTTTADATHFCNCKGDILIENCLFENMLDDACNVHGAYMKISEIVNSRTVRASLIHFQQTDLNFAKSSDSIQFIQDKTLLPISAAKVKSINKINEKYYEFIFEQDIPNSLKIDDGLESISWYPTFTFRNNIVRNNRARGVLVSTRNKIVIENNTFSSSKSAILIEGDMEMWYESGAVNDVLICNNKFLDNAYNGGGVWSVIWINPHITSIVPNISYERNIRIENNTFETFDNSILKANSVNLLKFTNNTIKPSTTYPKLNPLKPTIQIENCINTEIRGNRYEGQNKATIEIDETTAKTLKLDKKQVGFK